MHKFVADVHLGKLAKSLRLLGFDTAYKNDYSNSELLQISRQENRMFLSRNIEVQNYAGIRSFVVTSEDPLQQLKQVIDHFNLQDQFHPFSRCIVCNGGLESVTKESVLLNLEKNTVEYFSEFWQCIQCRRIYWKGSHYEKMLKTIEDITL